MQSFAKCDYPNLTEVLRLSAVTGLSERQISMWFVNKRARSKRRQQFGSGNINDCSSDTTGSDALSISSSPDTNRTRRQSLPSECIVPLESLPYDEYFANSRKQADLEFFQLLITNNVHGNTSQYWTDLDAIFPPSS
jgi:hypothetical protein